MWPNTHPLSPYKAKMFILLSLNYHCHSTACCGQRELCLVRDMQTSFQFIRMSRKSHRHEECLETCSATAGIRTVWRKCSFMFSWIALSNTFHPVSDAQRCFKCQILSDVYLTSQRVLMQFKKPLVLFFKEQSSIATGDCSAAVNQLFQCKLVSWVFPLESRKNHTQM